MSEKISWGPFSSCRLLHHGGQKAKRLRWGVGRGSGEGFHKGWYRLNFNDQITQFWQHFKQAMKAFCQKMPK